MCQICNNVHSRAQYNARNRILKKEREKTVKKLTTFKKMLERKYFPGKISAFGGISKHTSKHLNGDSLKHFSLKDIENPLKEENVFYSFPLWAPNYKIIWIPEYLHYKKDDNNNTKYEIFYYPGLFCNPSKEIIEYLKKNGIEVQFPNVK